MRSQRVEGAPRRFVWFGRAPCRWRSDGARAAGCLGSARARIDPYDLAAALLFAALVILVVATFGAYAISNDEEVQQRYGELVVSYYASGFADQAVFHFQNLYLYGGLFDIVAVGLEKLLPLDPYAVRHLLSGLIGVAGIAAVWAAAREIAGRRAGLIAAAALASCGIWYGAMFNHTKDIPFAAAMMGATYALALLARQLPRPSWRLVLTFGLLCGCALGLRVLGLFLFAYAGFVVVLCALTGSAGTFRAAAVFAARSLLALLPACVVAYLVMIAAWPWSAIEPLNPLRALTSFLNFHYPIETILAGHEYRMADVPRWYEPTYVAIKLTLPLLVGAALALVLTVLPQPAGVAPDRRRRGEIALMAVAAFFPLICDVAVRGPAFSGMRHVLFIAPPIAVLAGIGLDAALRRLAAINVLAVSLGTALVLLGLGVDAVTLYRLHPDEYLYFNPLVGGLQGATRRYATDYWVNIMPEAVADLERYLDRTEATSGRPQRRYLVSVCGERLPFEKVADRRLQWTKDWRRADFFIAPTHMNCDRTLDGRVVATVQRLGVMIGVVKDRRDIVHPTLAGGR